jgi:hypothetical protein
MEMLFDQDDALRRGACVPNWPAQIQVNSFIAAVDGQHDAMRVPFNLVAKGWVHALAGKSAMAM